MPGAGRYERYTDLHRRYVSWVVYAAPEFSVEAKTWWYPSLGHLKYRGYFARSDAEHEAERLRRQGLEEHVGEVDDYSTLGWFRDPVLNTCLFRTDRELAELIFHELTHVKLFLPGDTDFNEAFATANAQEGVRRWLRSKGDFRALARYEASISKDREIIRLLLDTRQKLECLYADRGRGPDAMRRDKAALFKTMVRDYAQRSDDPRYHRAFAKPWNNSRLNSVATYFDLVPGFERLLRMEHADLKLFYAAVEKMGRLSKEERRRQLRHD